MKKLGVKSLELGVAAATMACAALADAHTKAGRRRNAGIRSAFRQD